MAIHDGNGSRVFKRFLGNMDNDPNTFYVEWTNRKTSYEKRAQLLKIPAAAEALGPFLNLPGNDRILYKWIFLLNLEQKNGVWSYNVVWEDYAESSWVYSGAVFSDFLKIGPRGLNQFLDTRKAAGMQPPRIRGYSLTCAGWEKN